MITIKISRKIAAVRHRGGFNQPIEIPQSKEPYEAKFIEERGKKGTKFLALCERYPNYGMTLQEWREHGAEIHYSWWKFGWTLKPIEPSGSNQKTQKSNKPAQRAK